MNNTYAPPYYGGKHKLAPWISSLLPWSKKSLYVEPFSGMASVLLTRQPVQLEILNDLNGRVINWWRAVRNQPEEFTYLIDNMPRSRAELKWACENVDNIELSPIQRALAFHTIITQSIHHGDKVGTGNWQVRYSSAAAKFTNYSDRIAAIANRIRLVQLESRPAVEILERTKDCADAVIYADPPYASAVRSPYTLGEIDVESLAEVLNAQKGKVAVSGYEYDGWNELLPGWTKHTIDTKRFQINMPVENRTEVLWTNYQTYQPTLF